MSHHGAQARGCLVGYTAVQGGEWKMLLWRTMAKAQHSRPGWSWRIRSGVGGEGMSFGGLRPTLWRYRYGYGYGCTGGYGRGLAWLGTRRKSRESSLYGELVEA